MVPFPFPFMGVMSIASPGVAVGLLDGGICMGMVRCKEASEIPECGVLGPTPAIWRVL